MTIRGLIRELEKAEKKSGPRALVMIDLAEFKASPGILQDYTHYGAGQVRVEVIPYEDPVRGKELADGSERYRLVVSIGV